MAFEKSRPRIVFMGTPDFAVASLQALWHSEAEIAAVVTAPDKPAGRGRKIRKSAVKQWAMQHPLTIFQPDNLRDASFLQNLKDLSADFFVVVAFPILPEEVFTLPARGTINLHASLLPKYRGAAPIHWAIIEGEKETGVTTFLIRAKVDTGDILLQRRVPIGEDETFGELYDRLKIIGAELLLETVQKLYAGSIHPRKQSGTPTRAPKIKPEICQIDWQQPAERIRNLVRGLAPAPAAHTHLSGHRLKIFRCQVNAHTHEGRPGQILEINPKNGLFVVQAGKGGVVLQEVQLEGKKRMDTAAFLRGFPVRVGDVLN